MRKLIILILITLVVTGCAAKDYKTELAEALTIEANKEYERINNHNKKLYTFYIDPSVGNISSEKAYSVLEFLGNSFSMNLNVREIITNEYYNRNVINYGKDYLTFNSEGTYISDKGEERSYQALVYEDDGLCYLILKGDGIVFNSVLRNSQVYGVALKMMSILKSVEIDKQAVIESYSANDNITYVKETTELFTANITTTTTLDEIINRNENVEYEVEVEETEQIEEETQLEE